MRRVIKVIRLLLALTLSVLIVVSCFQSFYSPAEVKLAAFLGFAFPYLWVIGLVVLLFLMSIRSYVSGAITLLSLLVTFPDMSNIVNIVPTSENDSECGTTLKVVTLNVCAFRGGANGSEIAVKEIKELIADADLVCLQESPAGKMKEKIFGNQSLGEVFGFKYEVSDHHSMNLPKYGGIVQTILSRYPIKVDTPRDKEMDNLIMTTKVDVDGRIIRVINCHLESIKLSSQEIAAVDEAKHAEIHDNTKTNIRKTYSKMKSAFIARASQTDYLVELLKDQSDKTLLCGDFNDTPISYTYKSFRNILSDTFSRSFLNWGDTYNGKLPPLRIDYIMHTHDISAQSYKIFNNDCSDHFAVMAEIVIH